MDAFAAIADPTRRNILEMLVKDGKLASSEIAKRFLITPSAISQHLKLLSQARLVIMQKQAQQRIYEINPDAFNSLEVWTMQMTNHLKELKEEEE